MFKYAALLLAVLALAGCGKHRVDDYCDAVVVERTFSAGQCASGMGMSMNGKLGVVTTCTSDSYTIIYEANGVRNMTQLNRETYLRADPGKELHWACDWHYEDDKP